MLTRYFYRKLYACRALFLPFLVLFFILPLVACPLWGQVVQKKNLTPDSYAQWGNVELENISPDQKWASFRMRYKNGSDTLLVRNVSSLKTFNFPAAKNSVFSSGGMFFCQTGKDLIILDLSNGRKEIIKEISNFFLRAA